MFWDNVDNDNNADKDDNVPAAAALTNNQISRFTWQLSGFLSSNGQKSPHYQNLNMCPVYHYILSPTTYWHMIIRILNIEKYVLHSVTKQFYCQHWGTLNSGSGEKLSMLTGNYKIKGPYPHQCP